MSFAPVDITSSRLERVLEEGYSVRMWHYISRAWQLFRAEMGSMLGYSGLMILMTLVIFGIYTGITGILGLHAGNLMLSTLINLPISFLTVSIVAGYWFVMNRIAYDQPRYFGDFFDGFQKLVPLGITQIAITVFMYIPILVGLSLLIARLQLDFTSLNPVSDIQGYRDTMLAVVTSWEIWLGFVPAVFIYCLYLLALPLVCLDNLSPWEAMETSRKLVAIRLLPLTGGIVLSSILFMVGMVVCMVPAILLMTVVPILGLILYVGEFILFMLAAVPLYMGLVYAIYEDLTAPLRTDAFQQDLDEIGAPDIL